MTKRKSYKLINRRPTARFYYQGTHSHPIRRTVMIIEDLPEVLVGYEMREGNITRNMNRAPVKSYRKDQIARYSDYSRLPKPKGKKTQSTLTRTNLMSVIAEGV